MAISEPFPPPTGPRLWDEPPHVRYPDSVPFPPLGRLRCLPKGPHLIPPEPVERDEAGAVVLWSHDICACGHTWGEHRRSTIFDDHPFCHRCADLDLRQMNGRVVQLWPCPPRTLQASRDLHRLDRVMES